MEIHETIFMIKLEHQCQSTRLNNTRIVVPKYNQLKEMHLFDEKLDVSNRYNEE